MYLPAAVMCMCHGLAWSSLSGCSGRRAAVSAASCLGPRGRIMTCTPLPWQVCMHQRNCQNPPVLLMHLQRLLQLGKLWYNTKRADAMQATWTIVRPARALRTSQVYCRPDFVPLPWQVSHFTLRARDSFLQHGKDREETSSLPEVPSSTALC